MHLNESIKWINVEAKVSMEQTKEANGRGWKQNLNEKQQQPKFRSETKKNVALKNWKKAPPAENSNFSFNLAKKIEPGEVFSVCCCCSAIYP